MAADLVNKRRVIVLIILSSFAVVQAWDSIDLELFDLVEEIKENFYHILGVSETASQSEIRRAYRKLSLQLHPDKNKGPDAETKFRQLVAVSEILRDDDKRKRYDTIVRDGLPDWRQPVYYYRRVRKMGLFEFTLLIFLILTVGHYIVAWSIYLEKKFELEEVVFAKKEKEDKKRRKNRGKATIQDEDIPEITERLVQEVGFTKPELRDLLPFKLYRGVVSLCQSLPATCRDMIESWRERRKAKLEDEEFSESDGDEEKDQQPRPKRRHRIQPPEISSELDDADWEGAPVANLSTEAKTTQQNDHDITEKKSGQWTEEDRSLLVRVMSKFPGGTPGRWEKIALEMGRSLDEVTKQVKKMKQSYGTIPHPSDQPGSGVGPNTLLLNKRNVVISDAIVTRADDGNPVDTQDTAMKPPRNKPTPSAVAGKTEGTKSEVGKVAGKTAAVAKQKPNSTTTGTKEREQLAARPNKQVTVNSSSKAEPLPNAQARSEVLTGTVADGEGESDIWTQAQQKKLELALQQFPRAVADRWICIARVVPGKTKEDCISRFKFLAELVRQRKQSQQQ